MDFLRLGPPLEFAGKKVEVIRDYQSLREKNLITKKEIGLALESANLITFTMEDGSMVLARPSGTEPKLKLYYTAVSKSKAKAMEQISFIKKDMHRLWQEFSK